MKEERRNEVLVFDEARQLKKVLVLLSGSQDRGWRGHYNLLHLAVFRWLCKIFGSIVTLSFLFGN
jgi:hypothetical protein